MARFAAILFGISSTRSTRTHRPRALEGAPGPRSGRVTCSNEPSPLPPTPTCGPASSSSAPHDPSSTRSASTSSLDAHGVVDPNRAGRSSSPGPSTSSPTATDHRHPAHHRSQGTPSPSPTSRLADRISRPPHNWTPEVIWAAYEAVDTGKVKHSDRHTLTDLVSLLRYTVGLDKELVPYAAKVQGGMPRGWLSRNSRGEPVLASRRWWLDRMVDVIASSAGITADDLDRAPFTDKGGVDGALRDLGNRAGALIDEVERGAHRVKLNVRWPAPPLANVVDILDSRRVPVKAADRASRGESPVLRRNWPSRHDRSRHIRRAARPPGRRTVRRSLIPTSPKRSWLRVRLGLTTTLMSYEPCRRWIAASLKYYLDWFDYRGFANGTTRLKLTQAAMRRIPVPMPSEAEQRRIVEILEDHLSHLDAADAEIHRAQVRRSALLLGALRRHVDAARSAGVSFARIGDPHRPTWAKMLDARRQRAR